MEMTDKNSRRQTNNDSKYEDIEMHRKRFDENSVTNVFACNLNQSSKRRKRIVRTIKHHFNRLHRLGSYLIIFHAIYFIIPKQIKSMAKQTHFIKVAKLCVFEM